MPMVRSLSLFWFTLLPMFAFSQWYQTTHSDSGPLSTQHIDGLYHPVLLSDSAKGLFGLCGSNLFGRHGLHHLTLYYSPGSRFLVAGQVRSGGGSNQWLAHLGRSHPLSSQCSLGWRTTLVRTVIPSENSRRWNIHQLVESKFRIAPASWFALQVSVRSDRQWVHAISWHFRQEIPNQWVVMADFILPTHGRASWVINGAYHLDNENQRYVFQVGINLVSESVGLTIQRSLNSRNLQLNQGMHPHIGKSIGLGYESFL